MRCSTRSVLARNVFGLVKTVRSVTARIIDRDFPLVTFSRRTRINGPSGPETRKAENSACCRRVRDARGRETGTKFSPARGQDQNAVVSPSSCVGIVDDVFAHGNACKSVRRRTRRSGANLASTTRRDAETSRYFFSGVERHDVFSFRP